MLAPGIGVYEQLNDSDHRQQRQRSQPRGELQCQKRRYAKFHGGRKLSTQFRRDQLSVGLGRPNSDIPLNRRDKKLIQAFCMIQVVVWVTSRRCCFIRGYFRFFVTCR